MSCCKQCVNPGAAAAPLSSNDRETEGLFDAAAQTLLSTVRRERQKGSLRLIRANKEKHVLVSFMRVCVSAFASMSCFYVFVFVCAQNSGHRHSLWAPPRIQGYLF